MLYTYYVDELCTHLFSLPFLSSFLHKRISGGIPLGTIPLSISTRLSTTEKTDTGRSPPNNCVTLARCTRKKQTTTKERNKQQTNKEHISIYYM